MNKSIFLIACFLPAIALAQTLPAFEVASIKPAEPLTPAMVMSGQLKIGVTIDAARVEFGSLSLADLIRIAYKVKNYQVSGPDFITTDRYNVVAKLPEGGNRDQVPDMLKSLLAERFKLTVHHDTKDQNVYALIVAKTGLKMKEVEADPDNPLGAAAPLQASANADNKGGVVSSGPGGGFRTAMTPNGTMRVEATKMNMPTLADSLARFVDRPVVDMTELKGRYDLALDMSMEDAMNAARAAGMVMPGMPAPGPGGAGAGAGDQVSIFNSIQHYGLKLDARKAPVEMIVVDHVDKTPTTN